MTFNFLTLNAVVATQLPAKPAGVVKEGETQSKASDAALMTQDDSETEISHLIPGTNLSPSLFSTTENRKAECACFCEVLGYGVEKWIITTKPALPLVQERPSLEPRANAQTHYPLLI